MALQYTNTKMANYKKQKTNEEYLKNALMSQIYIQIYTVNDQSDALA